MKPYKNPQKFLWICPICFEEKTAGGDGHCRTQACAHMKHKHGVYEFAGDYYNWGLKIGTGYRLGHISKEQMVSLRETSKRKDE